MRVYHYGFFFYVSNFILQLTNKLYIQQEYEVAGSIDDFVSFYEKDGLYEVVKEENTLHINGYSADAQENLSDNLPEMKPFDIVFAEQLGNQYMGLLLQE